MISLGRGSGLRARVATGPEPNAHRRKELSECHRQDARPWVDGKGDTLPTIPSSLASSFSSEDGVAEKKDCPLTFNNALPVTGSATVKATSHSFHTSCLTFMRSVRVWVPMPSCDSALMTFSGQDKQGFIVKRIGLSVNSQLYSIAAALTAGRQEAAGP